jgi:hypothetical protein
MPIFTRRPRGRWGGGAARSRAAPPPGARRVERAGRVGVEAEYTGGAELVPEPRALPLRVLPRRDDHALARLGESERAREVRAPHVVPGGVPGRRVSRHGRGEPAHLVEPPGREHRVDACGNAVGERRAGVDHEVAHREARRSRAAGVEHRDAFAREQRDLDGAEELRPLQVGARRVEHARPPPQFLGRLAAEHAEERLAARGVERRLVEDRVGERAEVQPGAADHQGRRARPVARRHPRGAVVAPARGGPPLRRLGDVDAVVRHARQVPRDGLAVPTSNPR